MLVRALGDKNSGAHHDQRFAVGMGIYRLAYIYEEDLDVAGSKKKKNFCNLPVLEYFPIIQDPT